MGKKNIMERAEGALEYWDEDSMWARLIERDLKFEDYEALEYHLNEADSQKHIQDSFNVDFMERLLNNEPLIDTTRWYTVPMPEGVKDDVI